MRKREEEEEEEEEEKRRRSKRMRAGDHASRTKWLRYVSMFVRPIPSV